MNTYNIKRYINKIALGMLSVLTVTSCSLDEYNPSALSEENVLTNFEGWKAYQSNCYSGLWGSLLGMQYGVVSEAGTDLWTFSFDNHNQYKDVLAYEEFTINSGIVKNVWDFAWGSINNCNKTIELSEFVADGAQEDKTTLIAEARLLRAYYYSVLVAQFGEIPLVLSGNSSTDLSPKRTAESEVYAQIVKDLRFAFNNLGVTPFGGNAARVTKKTAFGLLARVYAQGAGLNLSEGSKSYWVRAKEVADSLIANSATYNAALYDDFSKVFASANNRNNEESLFTAYGLNPYDESYAYFSGNSKPNLYLHYYPKFDDAFGTSDLFKRGVNKNTSNAYYGRCNQQFIAPTKYLIDCFDAKYDKRWENSFVTAIANYSGVQAMTSLGSGVPSPAKVTYADATITLTEAMCTKYNIDLSHVGEKIYPYADVNSKNASQYATWQYIPKIWEKGIHTGNIESLKDTTNANLHPYPLAADEDRFIAYLSKETLTDADKKARRYVTVNIDDLFDLSADPTGSTYKKVVSTNGLTPSSLANLFPAMHKFNHNFDGSWLGGNFQQKLGNIMIMRMAEVYLIAAEASLHINSGNGAVAAGYLNELRKRACRNSSDFTTATGMQLSTATQDDVFDEYARELCGEFNRWALLKRNNAFESRLQQYNKTAYSNFNASIHYNRPIPFTFLNQIFNAEEFGNNGY